MAFAAAGQANPASRGTNKVHTVMEGQYRSLSYVGNHAPVVVDEPLHLFGQDTAPAPGEIVLSGLGGCLAVGITAVATWKQVKLSKLEVFLEGDIGNPAPGVPVARSRMTPPQMGFQAIRVKVLVEGDAPREVLDEIVQARQPLLARGQQHAQPHPLRDQPGLNTLHCAQRPGNCQGCPQPFCPPLTQESAMNPADLPAELVQAATTEDLLNAVRTPLPRARWPRGHRRLTAGLPRRPAAATGRHGGHERAPGPARQAGDYMAWPSAPWPRPARSAAPPAS
jgi:uncharacterized OsmC-like protein